jgi:glycosyltransferase involved in cell wall biosynthesis
MTLKAYCMKWHLTKSDAFSDLLVDALKDRLEIKLTDIEEWKPADSKQPTIFCQVKPPDELLNNPRAKVVWVPMWDNVLAEYSDQVWWDTLPKHIKIVCFSQALYDMASRAGLPCIRLKFYKNSDDFEPAQWKNRQIFYWNRRGLVGPQFLHKLCTAIQAEEIIFRPDLDPGAPRELYYELPSRLGDTSVKVINEMDRDSHFKAVKDSNILLAPRVAEGVGMTFIEAMSRSSAVLAYDASTMNEYIRHKQNGFLFNSLASRRIDKRTLRVAKRWASKQTGPRYALSLDQNWSDMAKIEWENLGAIALKDSQKGYTEWDESLDAYSNFLTAW